MRHQVLQRDRGLRWLGVVDTLRARAQDLSRTEVRDVGVDPVIQANSTVFDEQHHGAGCDELRAGEHAEDVILPQRQARFAVGLAVAEAVDHLAPTQQRGRKPRQELLIDLSSHRGVQRAEIGMTHGFLSVGHGCLANS